MTASEAIKWLKGIDKKYIHGGDEGFDNSRKAAISTAISALEKQISKKPLNREYILYDEYGLCPNCNEAVSDGTDHHWCSNCGQALDWSDTE